MLAKIINYITQSMTWKDWLLIGGLFLLLIALTSGVLWLLLGGAACIGPKVLGGVNKVNKQQQGKEDKIDEKTKIEGERLKAEDARREAEEAKKEKEREEANRQLPKNKTADELAKKIVDGIDNSGKE